MEVKQKLSDDFTKFRDKYFVLMGHVTQRILECKQPALVEDELKSESSQSISTQSQSVKCPCLPFPIFDGAIENH